MPRDLVEVVPPPELPLSQLCVTQMSDILNAVAALQREATRKVHLYDFLIRAAQDGEGREQLIATKYILKYFSHFPDRHYDAAKVLFGLLGNPSDSLRFVIASNISILGIEGSYHQQAIEACIQMITSPLEEEKDLAQDQLQKLLESYPIECATIIREALGREKERGRKAIFDFVHNRMRNVSSTISSSDEYVDIIEGIFTDELSGRECLGIVDEVIVYLGYSLVMDNFQRQQKIALHFIENLVLPDVIPAYCAEPSSLTTPGKVGKPDRFDPNAELDKFLARLSVVRQMFSILRRKHDVANDLVTFLIERIQSIYDLPLDRQIRALRTLADVAESCSSTFPEESVNKLFDELMILIPMDDDIEADSLPNVDYLKLEIVMLAIYRLRHTPALAIRLDCLEEEVTKKIRFLLRCCHVKSTEFKRVAQELESIPIKPEVNAELAATTSIGLIAIEIVKPVEQWKHSPRPSWKSVWFPKVTPKTVKRLRTERFKINQSSTE